MIKSGYLQPQEFEADSFAVKLLAAAGYSPSGLFEMLKILQNTQQNQGGGFFASHPAANERIANIQKQATGQAEMKKFFKGGFRFLPTSPYTPLFELLP
jgi:predicted Zn-dependent protease